MYLGWYDSSKTKDVEAKLKEALAAYARKFERTARVALVNPHDYPHVAGVGYVQVRAAQHVPPSTFFVGEEVGEFVAGR